jgi:Effector-associated domain 2/Trypsin-like peptidase domain
MRPDTPDAWRVRLRLPAGPVCGAGILVSASHVLTCAHAVPGGRDAPEGLAVDFPGLPGSAGAVARIAEWFPPTGDDRGDLAVLELASAVPPDVRPAPLRHCGPVSAGRDVRLYRHSPGVDRGVWVPARLTASPTGAERVRVDGAAVTDFRVELSFSGTAVADALTGDVIGMVVAEDRVSASKVAWMTPVEVIAGYWTRLAESLSPTPAEVVARRANALMELVNAINDLPSMRGPHGRDQVVNLLPWQIASAVPRHPERRFDVLGMVRTCLDYTGGLVELIEILRGIEGDATAMRRVELAVAALAPTG